MVLEPKSDATYAKTYEQVLSLGRMRSWPGLGTTCEVTVAVVHLATLLKRYSAVLSIVLLRNGIKAIHPYM